MTTTLSEGVKVPDVGSTDWADDLETNWNLLNTALAQQGSWAKVDEAQTFTGVQTFSDGIVGSLQGTANMAMSDADGNTITSTYATKTELSTLSDTVGTKADDSDVVHKADTETITGAKTFSATVTSADVVPSATDTYSLGSASVQYNGIYGKSYYYNGVAWGLDQNNTWTGVNTFTRDPAISKNNPNLVCNSTTFTMGSSAPSSNTDLAAVLFKDTTNANFAYLVTGDTPSGDMLTRLSCRNKFANGERSLTGSTITALLDVGLYSSGERYVGVTADSLVPFVNTANLGTSSNKWKTLNGINPGALSLPRSSADGIDIDRTNWVYDGATVNAYTPTVDGWVQIRCADVAGDFIFLGSDDKVVSTSGTGVITSVRYGLNALLPVSANTACDIRIKCSSNRVVAYFYPCQGNV